MAFTLQPIIYEINPNSILAGNALVVTEEMKLTPDQLRRIFLSIIMNIPSIQFLVPSSGKGG